MAEPSDKLQKSTADAAIKTELKAIREIVSALTPLSDEARASVISYVFRRLGISRGDAEYARHQAEPTADAARPAPSFRSGPVDIRTLKEEKQPSSAREM